MAIALCIVDVQKKFGPAAKVIKDTVHQIKLARRRKAVVIVVEYGYDGYDPSYIDIYDALIGYNNWAVVKKNSCGGGNEVIAAMDSNPSLQADKIRVCGVNTCACVRETVRGLKNSGRFEKIEIAEAATNCFHASHGVNDSCMEQLKAMISK